MGGGNCRHLRFWGIKTRKKDQKESVPLIWIKTGILIVVLDFNTFYAATCKIINHLWQRFKIQQKLSGKSQLHLQKWQSKQPEKQRRGNVMLWASPVCVAQLNQLFVSPHSQQALRFHSWKKDSLGFRLGYSNVDVKSGQYLKQTHPLQISPDGLCQNSLLSCQS